MGIDAAGFGELSTSASLHADPTVQSAARTEYPNRVVQLARLGIDWLTPNPLGSDRQSDPARVNVPHSYLGSRKRIALLDQVARLRQSPVDRSEFSREQGNGADSPQQLSISTGKGKTTPGQPAALWPARG
jgi:hypothetical protein